MRIRVFSLIRNWKLLLLFSLFIFNLLLLYYYVFHVTNEYSDVYKKIQGNLNDFIIPKSKTALKILTGESEETQSNLSYVATPKSRKTTGSQKGKVFPSGLRIPEQNITRNFTIDYVHDRFLKDGKPFQIISGSMEYFRIPRPYWRDRLQKLRAGGFNTLCMYVEWVTHEPEPGQYRFNGEQDLEYFIQLAVEEDLMVIFRPGPYISAEREAGGFPTWLMNKHPFLEYRTNTLDYKDEVEKWFSVLLPRVIKYLYGNGGPIIMVAIENEYGNKLTCDVEYKSWMKDLVDYYVRDKAALFTVDTLDDYYIRCGSIPNVLEAYDFGAWENMDTSVSRIRAFRSKGPIFNSEFWGGWPTHWATSRNKVNIDKVAIAMHYMLSHGMSVNFYMFHGGTNFGFHNGANINTNTYYPILTSYDYDALLDEAGDPTNKYFIVQDIIAKYAAIPQRPKVKVSQKGSYGQVIMKPITSIFDENIPHAGKMINLYPMTFEELDLKYGYVLYEATIPASVQIPGMIHTLSASALRDRAQVFLDQQNRVSILNRNFVTSASLLLYGKDTLISLLVENQGRVHTGAMMEEKKGLTWMPYLNLYGIINWTMKKFSLSNVTWVEHFKTTRDSINPPAFYIGYLVLPEGQQPKDTFVNMNGWGKGVIFVNDVNLGRYWPGVGSQVNLYVPGCYLHPAPVKNRIVIFETDSVPYNMKISFENKHNLDKIPPPLAYMS